MTTVELNFPTASGKPVRGEPIVGICHPASIKYRGFTAPAVNCREGSAWHDWQLAGAFFASENPDSSIDAAATQFAMTWSDNLESVAHIACKRAFIEGATR